MTRIYHLAVTVLAVCIGLLWPAAVSAQPVVSYTFCFEYLTDYTDAATNSGFLSDGDYPARGAKMRIIRNSNGDQYDFWLQTDGCKTINLKAEPWTVQLRRIAEVGNNTVEVKQDGTNSMYFTVVSSAFTPTDGGSNTWSVGPTNSIRIMAAATYAIYNRNGGISGQTWSFRDGVTNCGAGAAGCWHNVTKTVNIGSTLAVYKFGIVHELGHAMSDYMSGYLGFANGVNYNAALDACIGGDTNPGSHTFPSKEYNAAAAVEGIAHFMSAVTFNAGGGLGTPCTIEKHYKPDWNHSGGVSTGETEIFSCELGITATNPDVAANDYLGSLCLGTGQSNNRGNEYDWLRLFWDLNTDEGVLWKDILLQWDNANAQNWNATGDGTGQGYPAQEMVDAMTGVPPLDYDYNLWADWNGTDR